ncbi:hypothetical protein GCM10010124_31750 [Pilimelia terevasa]|uniref:Uncharacterized protein n=1 Tax=Pilimelia terevasa TaxID=53372 RepID=A0A8J3BSV3_9ACTN|nr:hypothetical protein [Pilimelia terevasa]GGK36756.1 hypothetical protein GCM10010124_31750 [Pilimelia terevasa]
MRNRYPEPAAGLGVYLQAFLDHHGYQIDDEMWIQIGQQPHSVLAIWSQLAAYAAADYQLALLHQPVAFLRGEVGDTNTDFADIGSYITALDACNNAHTQYAQARVQAATRIHHCLHQLHNYGALHRNVTDWDTVTLSPHRQPGHTVSVQAPAGGSPERGWPLVRVTDAQLRSLVAATAGTAPAPANPVIRQDGEAFVETIACPHRGNIDQLLIPVITADGDCSYLLRDHHWQPTTTASQDQRPD